MQIWKRNIIVCWFGMFVTAIGMSQIAPVLPLYVKHLGVLTTKSIEQFSGIAFGITFIISAIFSPVWGHVADKIGRKPMLLRASLGMATIVSLMGFSPNVYVLIGLRLLLGVITGYSTACTTLIATQTPKEQIGWSLATLTTSSISGSLLGPMLGGYLVETTGFRSVFWITGALLLVAFIATLIWVKENFVRTEQKVPGIKDVWHQIPDPGLILTLFTTTFMATVGLYSIEPILTVYIAQLSRSESHIALISGLTFAASGLSSILAAPQLGKLSDKIGPQKVVLITLIAAGVFLIPQALVNSPWQLMGFRFLLGLATAGVMPAINTWIKHAIPESITGRVYGFNISAQYVGVFCGSVLGGQLAAFFGIRSVFFVISTLLLVNALWVCKAIFRTRQKPALNSEPEEKHTDVVRFEESARDVL